MTPGRVRITRGALSGGVATLGLRHKRPKGSLATAAALLRPRRISLVSV